MVRKSLTAAHKAAISRALKGRRKTKRPKEEPYKPVTIVELRAMRREDPITAQMMGITDEIKNIQTGRVSRAEIDAVGARMTGGRTGNVASRAARKREVLAANPATAAAIKKQAQEEARARRAKFNSKRR